MTDQIVKLPRSSVLAFGFGAMGEAVYLGIFNAFITIYYNQVLGLSNTLIGVAVMVALIGDAITDPLVGIISDRWRSKHGRRHPFLFAAPIPIAISLYCIFNPPDFLTNAESAWNWVLFAWLLAWTTLSRAFITLYIVPHLALGGELSKNQHERSRLFSANSAFNYTAGFFFIFIAWSYFFAGERVRASDGLTVPGHLDKASYGPLIFLACFLIIFAIWVSAILTYKHVSELSEPEEDTAKLSIREFFREIFSTLKNRNYVIILIGYFCFMLASGIFDTLNTFIVTYFWELTPEQIRWFGLVAAPSALVGALIAPALMRRFDRKPVLLVALSSMVLFTQLMVDLRLLGLMPENGSSLLMPFLLANNAGFVFTIGICAVVIYSMLADVVDENELATNKRQEGLFYSARAFFAKAAYSFGHLVAGVGLDVFVRLPFKAVPGEVDDTVLFKLGVLAGPILAVSAIVSVCVYSRYQLSHKRHAEIMAGLEARKLAVTE